MRAVAVEQAGARKATAARVVVVMAGQDQLVLAVVFLTQAVAVAAATPPAQMAVRAL
jgi:hypothetical protein